VNGFGHLQRGEIILVRFPFIGSHAALQAKVRPAVVVSGPLFHRHTADVIVAAISSRPASSPLPTDYEIHLDTPEASASGLKRDSWVKAGTLATIPRRAALRRLRRLTAAGLQAVDECIRRALGW